MTREEAKAIETWAWNCDELEAEDRDELFRKLIHGLVDNASPIMIESVLDLMMKDDEELIDIIAEHEVACKTDEEND